MVVSTNGLELFTKNYLVTEPRARVLLTHGLAEHCQRYAHVAEAFNSCGIDVYTFDLRGHGLSEGERVFVKHIDEYREDLEAAYKAVPKDLPLFLVGHSMGGLIIFNFLMYKERPEVSGVVLSGAALEIGKDITPLTQKMLGIVGKILPRLSTIKLDANILSRDPNEVAKNLNDPLVFHGGAKAGLALAIMNGVKAAKSKFMAFYYPVLIMHGEADKLTNPGGSITFFDQSPSSDKSLKLWPEAYHEIFNETNKEEIIAYTSKWILQHSGK